MFIPVRVYKGSTLDSDGTEPVIYGLIFCGIFGSIGAVPGFTYILLSDSVHVLNPIITAIEFISIIPIMPYLLYPGFLIHIAYTVCISYIVVVFYAN